MEGFIWGILLELIREMQYHHVILQIFYKPNGWL